MLRRAGFAKMKEVLKDGLVFATGVTGLRCSLSTTNWVFWGAVSLYLRWSHSGNWNKICFYLTPTKRCLKPLCILPPTIAEGTAFHSNRTIRRNKRGRRKAGMLTWLEPSLLSSRGKEQKRKMRKAVADRYDQRWSIKRSSSVIVTGVFHSIVWFLSSSPAGSVRVP